jgi:hypothetical protein
MNFQKLFQIVFFTLSVLVLSSCAINDKQLINSGQALLNQLDHKKLTENDIAAGLKEALIIGSERVVSQLSKQNGYLNDKAIHIELPENLQKVHKTLEQLNLGHYTRELETKMNHAAEIAAPKAKEIFYRAIKEMRWQDVKTIYNGNNDAATQYFIQKMTPSLKRMMKPLIDQTLAQVGVVKAYARVVKQYHAIPFVPQVKSDLTEYVMTKGIDGLFYYLAKEEAAIRNDPAKRPTALLKRVFAK